MEISIIILVITLVLHLLTESVTSVNISTTSSQILLRPPKQMCNDTSYSGLLGLSFSYSLETLEEKKDFPKLANSIEKLMIDWLANGLLSCDFESKDVRKGSMYNTDLYVVGIGPSLPDKIIQNNCTNKSNEPKYCAIIKSTLTLYLSDVVDKELILFLSRNIINTAMIDGDYKSQLPYVNSVTYLAPDIEDPTIDDEVTDAKDAGSRSSKSANTTAGIVMVAALFSAVVGAMGVFILSRTFRPRRLNCLNYCDNSGIDSNFKEYNADEGRNDKESNDSVFCDSNDSVDETQFGDIGLHPPWMKRKKDLSVISEGADESVSSASTSYNTRSLSTLGVVRDAADDDSLSCLSLTSGVSEKFIHSKDSKIKEDTIFENEMENSPYNSTMSMI